MVISYSCFHFGPKYYRLAVSDGHYYNRLLRLKLSALTANVGPRRQPDHSCMQLGSKWQAHGSVYVLIRHQQCPITLLSGHPSVHFTRVHNTSIKA